MTDEQFKELQKELATLRNNQQIINQNIVAFEQRITAKLDTLQSDMHVSLNNDQIAESYFQLLKEEIGHVKILLNK